MLVYVTSPVKAVVGVVGISKIQIDSPNRLWREVRDFASISRADYVDYFDGARQAVGLWLNEPIKLDTPILLEEIRNSWPELLPPQSFKYIRDTTELPIPELSL